MKILSVRKSMELVPALRKSINDEGQTLGSSKIKSQIEGDGFSFLLFLRESIIALVPEKLQ